MLNVIEDNIISQIKLALLGGLASQMVSWLVL
jgi:hypothetical protein